MPIKDSDLKKKWTCILMQTYSFQVLSKDVKVPWLKRETWKEHAIYCKFWIALSSIFLWRLYFLTICVPIRHKTLQKRRPWGIARRFPTISRCLTNSQPCVGSLSADLETGKWQLDDHNQLIFKEFMNLLAAEMP